MNTTPNNQGSTRQAKRFFITGGAGFIGSHLVRRLLALGHQVTVFDMFVDERAHQRLPIENSHLNIIQGDFSDDTTLDIALRGHQIVVHLAAYTDTRTSGKYRARELEYGVIATWRLLEGMQRHKIREIFFVSSQHVYGDLALPRITESSGPLLPISLYGANKLACEGIISAYCHMFAMRASICRFSNVIGGGQRYGIIPDFIQKLRRTPERLEVLGTGQQARSYVFINDAIEAILLCLQDRDPQACQIYNVGNYDAISAADVGRIVIEEMGLSSITALAFTGEERGWKGDLQHIEYDLTRICSLGWKPTYNSAAAVHASVRLTLDETTCQGLKYPERGRHTIL